MSGCSTRPPIVRSHGAFCALPVLCPHRVRSIRCRGPCNALVRVGGRRRGIRLAARRCRSRCARKIGGRSDRRGVCGRPDRAACPAARRRAVRGSADVDSGAGCWCDFLWVASPARYSRAYCFRRGMVLKSGGAPEFWRLAMKSIRGVGRAHVVLTHRDCCRSVGRRS
jgi:hypothetical protein